MASVENWIKLQKETREKPEVRAMAKRLGCSSVDIIGACAVFWMYADSNMREGFIPLTDPADVDEIVMRKGFAEALEAVCWARFADGGCYVPKADSHLSNGAKDRAEATARQHKSRADRKLQQDGECHESARHPVTDSCDTLSRKTVNREEKRREEDKAAAGASEEVDDDWQPVAEAAEAAGVIYPLATVKGAAKKGYTPRQALTLIATYVEYRDEIDGPGFLHTRLTQQSPKLDRLDGWGKRRLKPRASPAVVPLTVLEAQFFAEGRKHNLSDDEIRRLWQAHRAKHGGTAA